MQFDYSSIDSKNIPPFRASGARGPPLTRTESRLPRAVRIPVGRILLQFPRAAGCWSKAATGGRHRKSSAPTRNCPSKSLHVCAVSFQSFCADCHGTIATPFRSWQCFWPNASLDCVFHVKLPPIPRQSCHPFQGKVATHSRPKLPPLGAQRRGPARARSWTRVSGSRWR